MIDTFRVCLVLGLLGVGCAPKVAPDPTVGATCKAENDGKDVTVTGVLTTPVIVGACSDRCWVDLTEKGEYSDVSIQLGVPAGEGKLSMKPLPSNTTGGVSSVGAAAFTVTDSDGKQQPVGSRVRVTGRLTAKTHTIELGGGKEVDQLRCELAATAIVGAPPPLANK